MRQKTRRTARPKAHLVGRKQPFKEHLLELRRRLYIVAASVLVFSTATYFVQMHLVNALLRPANGQNFIYTSPGGGLDFLFRVCLYSGFILSTPVVVYQFLKFIDPLIRRTSSRFITLASLACGGLALCGVAFGYFLGLPAALEFLLHQFTTVQIKPLVTVQSYLGFVMAFLLGSALLFQMPLILLLINRIKPLRPSKLLSMHYQRWVIVSAFILAALMNPSPNPVSLLIIALPFIGAYYVGIIVVAVANKPRYKAKVRRLLEQDAERHITRQSQPRSITTLEELNLVPVTSHSPSQPVSRRPANNRTQRLAQPYYRRRQIVVN